MPELTQPFLLEAAEGVQPDQAVQQVQLLVRDSDVQQIAHPPLFVNAFLLRAGQYWPGLGTSLCLRLERAVHDHGYSAYVLSVYTPLMTSFLQITEAEFNRRAGPRARAVAARIIFTIQAGVQVVSPMLQIPEAILREGMPGLKRLWENSSISAALLANFIIAPEQYSYGWLCMITGFSNGALYTFTDIPQRYPAVMEDVSSAVAAVGCVAIYEQLYLFPFSWVSGAFGELVIQNMALKGLSYLAFTDKSRIQPGNSWTSRLRYVFTINWQLPAGAKDYSWWQKIKAYLREHGFGPGNRPQNQKYYAAMDASGALPAAVAIVASPEPFSKFFAWGYLCLNAIMMTYKYLTSHYERCVVFAILDNLSYYMEQQDAAKIESAYADLSNVLARAHFRNKAFSKLSPIMQHARSILRLVRLQRYYNDRRHERVLQLSTPKRVDGNLNLQSQTVPTSILKYDGIMFYRLASYLQLKKH